MDSPDTAARPSVEQISEELERRRHGQRTRTIVRNTVFGLVCVAAVAVLLATLFLPTLKIYGNSMESTLAEGQVVVSYKDPEYVTGDIVAFYYNNKILVKRVICGPGDWFNMADDGTVFVNGTKVDEPYVSDNSFGPCDLDLPYQVPEGHLFVMGDQRSSSMDSRMSQVGCVYEDQIVGHIFFCIWPLDSFGVVS